MLTHILTVVGGSVLVVVVVCGLVLWAVSTLKPGDLP